MALALPQEAVVAKKCFLFWGDAEIDATDILVFCVWCFNHVDLCRLVASLDEVVQYHRVKANFILNIHYLRLGVPQPWFMTRPLLRAYRRGTSTSNLVTTFRIASDLIASDARDHIYAFLGCPYATYGNRERIISADYTCPKKDVYIDVASALLQHPQSGPWLFCALIPQGRSALSHNTIPPWVPIWGYKPDLPRFTMSGLGLWYRASGPEECFEAKPRQDETLKIRGVLFDKISWTSELLQVHKFTTRYQESLQAGVEPYIDSLWRELQAAAKARNVCLQQEDFFRALQRDHPTYTGTAFPGNADYIAAYRKALRLATVGAMETEQLSTSENQFARWLEQHLALVVNNRVALTAKGRIGIVQPCSDVGNACCIFAGVSVPFILMPSNEGRSKIVGEAFIQGVMDGEVAGSLNSDFETAGKNTILE